MESILPEKAALLKQLKKNNFNVPDFIYVPATDFQNNNFTKLDDFFNNYNKSYKVIARSAHPQEKYFKGGTFDSIESYADIDGIKFARNRIINSAKTSNRLSILRQNRFNGAPEIDLNEMGIIVMPFIDGSNVMAKMFEDHWEFGYCHDRIHKVRIEPYITKTPHNIKLLDLSEDIQKHLGFSCEIEYIIAKDRQIHVVQAKDISHVEILEIEQSKRSIKLDGIRRIRSRRNYRERPIFVMDNDAFYLKIISKCEDMIHDCKGNQTDFDEIINIIASYETKLENFALKYERFAVIGLSIHAPAELYQMANHCLDEIPEYQKKLSEALQNNLFKIDYFLSETDTLIAKNKVSINICTHDAYGIDTLRYPLWPVYWAIERHDRVVNEFKRLGFKTGDAIGIDIDSEEKPTVFRL